MSLSDIRLVGAVGILVLEPRGYACSGPWGVDAATLVSQIRPGGYAFGYAAGLVTGGRLGDLLGYRRMFTAGMTAFTVASLLCGPAQTPAELIGARACQMVGEHALMRSAALGACRTPA
jgi:MFS family permease